MIAPFAVRRRTTSRSLTSLTALSAAAALVAACPSLAFAQDVASPPPAPSEASTPGVGTPAAIAPVPADQASPPPAPANFNPSAGVQSDSGPTGADLRAPTASPSLTPPALGAPLAGYHNGVFYLRDPDDDFRLYVQGRVHVDYNGAFGSGVGSLAPASAIKNGFTLRRVRLEMAGEIIRLFQWQISGEFGPTATDNPGSNSSYSACSVDATTSAQACSARENPVEAAGVRSIPADAFVNFAPSPWANLQAGQYLVPFTMEARVSDNTTPFLERALAVRNIGAPTTRDIGAMFWGEAPNRLVYYTVGIYNGDGQNRLNQDNRYDFIGRAFVRPLVLSGEKLVSDAQLGFSVRYGSRDPKLIGYDLQSLTTQGGFAYWRPTYTDSQSRLIHIMPSGDQIGIAGDIYLPIGRADLTSEFIYTHNDTREAVDGYQLSSFTERTGTLKGYAYYIQAGFWVVGDRNIVGYPSHGRPLHADLAAPQRPARQGVQVVAKYEQLHLSYSGAARGGKDDSKTPDGDIDIKVAAFGINYWASRHLRIGLNYSANFFPGSAPTSASETGGPVQTSNQRAVAPAQLVAKGADNTARDSGHAVNEIEARVGVQF